MPVQERIGRRNGVSDVMKMLITLSFGDCLLNFALCLRSIACSRGKQPLHRSERSTGVSGHRFQHSGNSLLRFLLPPTCCSANEVWNAHKPGAIFSESRISGMDSSYFP